MKNELLRLVPLAIVCALLIRRTRRPRVIRLARLWISPALLLAICVCYILAAERLGPPLPHDGSLIIAAAAVGGVLVGAARAQLLKLHRQPDTGAIQATFTMWGILLLAAWYVGRRLLDYGEAGSSRTPFSLLSDAALALAAGAVLAQAVVLARRCKLLAEARTQT
ncbi:MAG: hypothetical protein ACREU3_16390 [Steroidobacteraceae bacterium]